MALLFHLIFFWFLFHKALSFPYSRIEKKESLSLIKKRKATLDSFFHALSQEKAAPSVPQKKSSLKTVSLKGAQEFFVPTFKQKEDSFHLKSDLSSLYNLDSLWT